MDILARYSNLDRFIVELSIAQREDTNLFVANWNKNKARYDEAGAKANVPSKLVAAINWREESGSFSGYLHNGDPLGSPTVHVPKNLYFPTWEAAAADALSPEREPTAWDVSGMSQGASLAQICAFAEGYNGLGYAKRGFPSPYVLAGTSGYVIGKFTDDGVFDESATDKQVGVFALIRAISV